MNRKSKKNASLRRKLRQAYDPIHAPENAIEQLKHELYRQELHMSEDAEYELYNVEEASRRPGILKYLVYIAAVLALCVGVGMFWQHAQNYKNDFHPATQVTQPEETSETGAALCTVPDIANYHYEYAKKIIEQEGFHVELVFEYSDESPASNVIRTSPIGNASAPEGSTVIVYVSQGAEGE